jgi:biopolymer transport protein ExbD
MMGRQDGNAIIAGINVTPLVDIALVLLVVFIVTAKMIVSLAVPLDLPRASHTEDVQAIFAVSLPAAGPMLVNGDVVDSDDGLLQMAKAAFTRDPDLRAVIHAEGAVRHRHVIRTLDILRRAGLVRVAFGALPPEEAAQ